MLDEQRFYQISKSVLLALLDLQEEISATQMALREAGLVSTEALAAVRFQVKEKCKALRETIEQLGSQSIDDVLRAFEGPIQ